MRRLEFKAQTKRAALARSAGVCECHLVPALGRSEGCGVRLRPGGVFFEHIYPSELGGNASLGNCAALCTTCWREKTDKHDRPIIAKANRVRDRVWGIPRDVRRPLPGGRGSSVRIRMRGGPVDRMTGERL